MTCGMSCSFSLLPPQYYTSVMYYCILQSSGMDFKSTVSQYTFSCSPAFGGLCLCSIKTSPAQWLEKLAFVSWVAPCLFLLEGRQVCRTAPVWAWDKIRLLCCCGCLVSSAMPVSAGVKCCSRHRCWLLVILHWNHRWGCSSVDSCKITWATFSHVGSLLDSSGTHLWISNSLLNVYSNDQLVFFCIILAF